MTEITQEQIIKTTLYELNINQLVQATNNFLELLENRDPKYVPNTINPQTLVSIAGRYFGEYRPLLAEWGRRQTADTNYKPAEHFPLIQKLQGQMPEDLRQELNELQRRQTTDANWDPQTDGARLQLLQKIDDFYRRGGQLPFPWLDFCLNYAGEIKQFQQSLWKKQATENLSPEETDFLNFLTESGVGEILD